LCLILIILTWYQRWFYGTRLNPEHSFRGSNFAVSWLGVCRGQRAPAEVRGRGLKIFWSYILSSASAKFGISSSAIWYLRSVSAIWYLRSVSAIILVFHLPFSFCNLVFVFSFCNYFGILSRRYLFSFCNLYLVSAIWYFVFRCFCILVLCDCWLWLLKKMIHFSLCVWGWMGKTIRIGVI
jgi:hypothetical protein